MTESTSHTALITGGSRGLGLALAQGLAQLHWNLIIDARGVEALNAARDELARLTSVIAIAGDVTDAAHRGVLASAAAKMGGLDALVNSASILGPSPQPPLLEYPLDVLERVRRMPLASDPVLGASTVNIGTIHGGRAPNVIPDHAQAEVFVRLVDDGASARAAVAEAAGEYPGG